jgi:pimeloyl-ACP methyl ester carboxylesterase
MFPREDELRRADLANGVELHYVRAGAGVPVFLIHGAMGDWRSWQPQWDALTAHFDCVSYSRRYSHPNRNSMPSPAHSALVDAEDLDLFMDALGIGQALLVGSSYGGFAALAQAVRRPERVLAVVAVEPPMMRYAYMSEDGAAAADAFRRSTIEVANDAFRRDEDALAVRIMTSGIVGAASPLSSEAQARRMQNMRAMKMLALSQDEFPLLPKETLAALPMPVLLVSGAETPPVHAAIFRNLCAAMPNAERAVVPGAGHSVASSHAAVFNPMATAFLRSALATEPRRRSGA